MWGGGEGRADPFIGPAAFSGPAGENDCRPGPAGNAVFPTTASPKYSGESAGKARMQTCLDQYRANKANGGNGGLKWIEKGGGYYSECNKHLKGGGLKRTRRPGARRRHPGRRRHRHQRA